MRKSQLTYQRQLHTHQITFDLLHTKYKQSHNQW